jgi:MFS family permease
VTRSSTPMAVTHHNNIPIVVCAMLAAVTTGGPTYAFGLYGATLKDTLQLTQSQLDTLSSAYFCAGLLTWIPGLVVDRYGVRRAMTLGGILGAFFMCLYWVVARQWLVLPSIGWTLAALCACGVGSSLANGLVIGSIYKILVCTCTAETKGSAVGAAKGYVGLGSGVYACLFQAIKARLQQASDLDFLPMAAALALLASTVPAYMLLPDQEQMKLLWNLPIHQVDKTNGRHFLVLYAGLFALALMVVATSLGELRSNTNDNFRDAESSHESEGLLLLLLWLGPIFALRLVPTSEDQAMQRTPLIKDVEDATESTLLHCDNNPHYRNSEASCLESAETTLNEADSIDTVQKDAKPHESGYKLTELVQTSHAWSLLWVALVLVGSGTMMTNNMGQMVESLALSSKVTPALMAIFSVSQAVSRIVTGAVSDVALASRYRVPRPFFLVVASLVGAVAHTVLALTQEHDQNLFLFGVVLSGIAFGMIWPLMVLIVGEVFGTAHMATNYLFYDGLASAMGTLLLSKFVTQEVYEAHIDDKEEDLNVCYGAECFQASHWTAVVLALSCVLASICLLKQTQEIYAFRASSIRG